ncbi:TIGR02391 family protein [uncultured Microbacterium sp.]|uniref:TIGR02391 family protein n=1 Tax=uncultured Microbacterium sp. TaxID=191216 RepID=UPI002636DF0B|nr:TIGR02391 family protein [uncultured Microbacterium sp.]
MTDLKLTFDPMTIEHLGFKMYSHLPNAVAELIANSYDADATEVSVIIADDGRSISVNDNGHGMSIDEIQNNYLRIGRNRRASGTGDLSESGRRKVAGRKGLGKLSVFGIGNTIVIESKREGSAQSTKVTMVWDDIRAAADAEYRPNVDMLDTDSAAHFTRIHVSDLSRKSEINPQLLAEQLSRLFNYADDDFHLDVRRGSDHITVDRRLRYSSFGTEATWEVPTDFPKSSSNAVGFLVTGEIFASKRPLPPHLRGITLYVRGRMANEPEFFGVPDSSQAYAYLTGYLDADDLDTVTDVISTDRRSVSWESEWTAELQAHLAAIVREAAAKRRALRERENKKKVQTAAGVDIEAWTSSIQGRESAAVKRVLETLTSPDNEIEDDDRKEIVDSLREIAPDYADLHWRALHESIQEAAEQEYKSGNYHHAVVEAIKRYVRDVRSASGVSADMDELAVLQSSFSTGGSGTPRVDVVAPYMSFSLSPRTQKNIRDAQKTLSEAAWTGFRNLIQHEGVRDLLQSGVFTYQDCLDALSLISHLRRRVGAIESATTDT